MSSLDSFISRDSIDIYRFPRLGLSLSSFSGTNRLLLAVGTGEHGVGISKKEFLYDELGEGTVELMKTIKRAIDPLGLFNPGKVSLRLTFWRSLKSPPRLHLHPEQNISVLNSCIPIKPMRRPRDMIDTGSGSIKAWYWYSGPHDDAMLLSCSC